MADDTGIISEALFRSQSYKKVRERKEALPVKDQQAKLWWKQHGRAGEGTTAEGSSWDCSYTFLNPLHKGSSAGLQLGSQSSWLGMKGLNFGVLMLMLQKIQGRQNDTYVTSWYRLQLRAQDKGNTSRQEELQEMFLLRILEKKRH